MRGDISSAKASRRHPLDWYVEQGWEWDQLARALDFVGVEVAEGVVIWDPAAGYGHCGSRLESWGAGGRIWLSDVVENVTYGDFLHRPDFFHADFLECTELPEPVAMSIWSNPPYSYKPGILEAFARQALKLATHRVVFLVPLKWLAGGLKRGRFFREDFPPQRILYFTQRPSMPPGDRIHLMGNRAFRGGVIDYAAVVWDLRTPTQPGETRSVWLPRLTGEL